jgi:hypothetical protein
VSVGAMRGGFEKHNIKEKTRVFFSIKSERVHVLSRFFPFLSPLSHLNILTRNPLQLYLDKETILNIPQYKMLKKSMRMGHE